MTVSRTLWQNVQQYIWLVGGIVCLFLAFIFWVITDNSVHDKFHRTLILSGFCLLKIAKISL
ncbi:hypothetical protein KSA20_09695, partial [Acinetobacter baumannii]|nr:hypothetical protein [Acinetobacter baumannii]